MKGAIFIALNDMIESQYGIDTWEELLDTVQPGSEGIYTSTENYPDQEIVDFVIAISEKLQIPSSDVTRVFGRFLFDELNSKYPIFTQLTQDLIPFLKSIESVIHKEVRKLYDNASLPSISYKDEHENGITMVYSSPRKLCFLSEGLIFGAADHFKRKIELTHETCMHKGDEHCELVIKLID